MADALEYLLLPIDERINYRHERNLGLMAWYSSVAENLEMPDGPITRYRAHNLLNISLTTIGKLVAYGILKLDGSTSSNRTNQF